MTHDELVLLVREALRAARMLTECDALALLAAERVMREPELAQLRAMLGSERMLEQGFLAELSPVVAQAEQALMGETRTAVIDHDTGCDGETLEQVTELTRRGHRIVESARQLQVLHSALAELHDAVVAIRAANRLVSER